MWDNFGISASVSQRIVAELPPGLPETDWCVASESTRNGDIPQPDRWP